MKTDELIVLFELKLKELDSKNFDLEAWKLNILPIVEKVFGKNSEKYIQLNKLEYHFGSWSLRDTSGESNYAKSCIGKAKGIVNGIIDEIRIFGLPEKEESAALDINAEIIREIGESGGELVARGIKEILNKKEEEEKVSLIMSELNYFSENTLKEILAKLLVKNL